LLETKGLGLTSRMARVRGSGLKRKSAKWRNKHISNVVGKSTKREKSLVAEVGVELSGTVQTRIWRRKEHGLRCD